MTIELPRDGRPFVLLDDAQVGGDGARLYLDPVEVIATRKAEEVGDALRALRVATKGGLDAAGFLSFEAGCALENVLASKAAGELPLLWFGLFRSWIDLPGEAVPALLRNPESAWLSRPVPVISRKDYGRMLDRALALIGAGDIYQVNLTFPNMAQVAGPLDAIYAGLRLQSGAKYGALINTGRDWLMSLSPELFFSLDGGAITARPMKGTAPRATDPAEDAQLAKQLGEDPKQRAENLMIVDLVRNDLSRVAVPGTVSVPSLFDVETFPTLHQLTSTVTATMAAGVDAVDVIEALYPSGSVTGAPKIRALEIIDELENTPRGAYTGSIGRIDGNGDSAFNVAIRTLHVQEGLQSARLGLGSGIVADSTSHDEWHECLLKGRFAEPTRVFDLTETMTFDPIDGLVRLEAHLARMTASAEALGFAFDRHDARNELQAATFRLREPARVRLLLSIRGRLAIETSPLPSKPTRPVEVALRPLPVEQADFRLRHKTTDRAFYDQARRETGAFEVIFHDEDGRLTEGSFTNVFVERDGVLLTPPLALGLLPGVLRATLIAEGQAVESRLTRHDLGRPFFIGNSLRGLLPATLTGL